MVSFKERHTFEARKAEADRVQAKYPDRIPVIVELAKKTNLPPLDKEKYLVPHDLTIGQFLFVLRKRIKLTPEQSIFVFINDTIPPTSALLSNLYKEHKDSCGYLFMTISGDSTFGVKFF